MASLVHDENSCAEDGHLVKSKSEGSSPGDEVVEEVEEEKERTERKVKHRSCGGSSGGKKTVAAQVNTHREFHIPTRFRNTIIVEILSVDSTTLANYMSQRIETDFQTIKIPSHIMSYCLCMKI